MKKNQRLFNDGPETANTNASENEVESPVAETEQEAPVAEEKTEE